MRTLGFILDFFSWTIVLVIVVFLAAPIMSWVLARRLFTWLHHRLSFKITAVREVALGTVFLMLVFLLVPD